MSNLHPPTGPAPTGPAPTGPASAGPAAPVDPARQAERKAEHESLGTLMSQVSNDLSTLIRQETALAKAELSESAKKSGKGAGMLGGAGIAGHFVLLFLSIALWAGISSTDLGSAWSAVIVAVIWLIIAAVLAVLGKKNLEQVKGAPQTTETLKEVPDALTPTKENR